MPIAKDTKEKATETRTIFLEMNNGEKKQISNIPANAKITFGKIHAAGGGGRGSWNGDPQNCLRIYTSESNQLAVFVGVREFRDETLTIHTKQTVKKSKKQEYKKTGDVTTFDENQTEVEEWVTEIF